MAIESKDEVWFVYNNRIQKGIVLQEEEHGVEGWYSLWRVQTKCGSQIIEDYRLFDSKDKLVDEISEN
jgi:hypothetical protein